MIELAPCHRRLRNDCWVSTGRRACRGRRGTERQRDGSSDHEVALRRPQNGDVTPEVSPEIVS